MQHHRQTLSAAFVACLFLTVSANAFSPIWDVNGWTKERLSDAGIRIAAWTHELQRETPALPWVRVTFDCRDIPEDQPVIMTLWLRVEDQPPIAVRSERTEAAPGEVTLTFTVAPEQLKESALDIYIWSPTPDGGREARGYQLSLTRIAELAGKPDTEGRGE